MIATFSIQHWVIVIFWWNTLIWVKKKTDIYSLSAWLHKEKNRNLRAALNLGPSVLLMAFGHRASVLWKWLEKDRREALLGEPPATLSQSSSMLVSAVCDSWIHRQSQGRSQDSVFSFQNSHLVRMSAVHFANTTRQEQFQTFGSIKPWLR